MIEFRDSSNVLAGIVASRGLVLLSDPAGESVAASWLRAGGSVGGFEDAYDGWTNGYVTGSRVANDPIIMSDLTVVQVPGMVSR